MLHGIRSHRIHAWSTLFARQANPLTTLPPSNPMNWQKPKFDTHPTVIIELKSEKMMIWKAIFFISYLSYYWNGHTWVPETSSCNWNKTLCMCIIYSSPSLGSDFKFGPWAANLSFIQYEALINAIGMDHPHKSEKWMDTKMFKGSRWFYQMKNYLSENQIFARKIMLETLMLQKVSYKQPDQDEKTSSLLPKDNNLESP